jgi:hypothetical protein
MQLEQEARIWQTIGIIAWAAGSGMLLMLFKQNGMVRVTDLGTLSAGLSASFLILAGIAGTVFGRVMAALLHGYNHQEARLWHLFASVCCSCGAFAILYLALATWQKTISLTRVTIGLAGAFFVMTGVICLLGNRVMDHATKKYEGGAQAGDAKAASA